MNKHLLQQKDSINSETLKDITEVGININLPSKERMNDFLAQVKNPYRFKCNDIVVNISFDQEEKNALDQLLIDYFKREKDYL